MPKGTVLIIEDEEDVREVMVLHLHSAGYDVVEAENGEDGLNILRAEDNMINIDLVLCDIRMPKVDGGKFVEILKKEAPRVPGVMGGVRGKLNIFKPDFFRFIFPVCGITVLHPSRQ